MSLIPAISKRLAENLFSPRVLSTCFGPRRRCSELPNLQGAKRILVVRLDEPGDTILTLPFLWQLRQNAPRAHITLATRPSMVNLFKTLEWLDEVIGHNEQMVRWRQHGVLQSFNRHLSAWKLAKSRLRHPRYDLCIHPRWDTDNYNAGVLVMLSHASCRVGYSETVVRGKAKRNRGFDNFYTYLVKAKANKHEVELGFDILQVLGGSVEAVWPDVPLLDADRAKVRELLPSGAHGPTIALGIGTRVLLRKQWPLERYIEVCRCSIEKHNSLIVCLGGADERELGEKLKAAFPEEDKKLIVNAIGQTSWRESLALLECCQLFVGNDSAAKHLAAVLSKPIIEICCHPKTAAKNHFTSPVRFKAWNTETIVLQPEKPVPPCPGHCFAEEPHCILEVSTEQVVTSIERVLSDNCQ